MPFKSFGSEGYAYSSLTDEQIKKCIKTGELQLTDGQRETHFVLAIGLALGALATLGFCIFSILNELFYSELRLKTLLGLLLPAVIGGLAFFFFEKQRKKLLFTTIKFQFPRSEVIRAIDRAGAKLNWKKIYANKKHIIGKTPSRVWSESSYGEQITIIFAGEYILINSINDPDKETAMVGPNKKNIEVFIKEFEETKVKLNKKVKKRFANRKLRY